MENLKRPAWAERTDVEREYYDTEWGMPVTTETGVFERLTLEVFQSGLSWLTILRRRGGFRDAFHGFAVDTVASFDTADIDRLVTDASIIRNRRKIVSTINNARAAIELRDDPTLGGRGAIEAGLPALVWSYRPREHPVPDTIGPAETAESIALAKDLKLRGFLHLGPITAYAMMQAIGVVNDHPRDSWRRPHVDEAVAAVLAKS